MEISNKRFLNHCCGLWHVTILALICCVFSGGALAASNYSWSNSVDSTALLNGNKIVWQHHHKKSEGKPYFHPLSTVDGDVLTAFRPADHPWHRALWLSWKKINGINYWEEDRKTGLSQGRTEIVDVKINTNKDFSARIQMTLSYHPPEKAEVMTEKRVIIISAPDKDGSYHLDWASTTMAVEDVTLDRTPIPGQPGGVGYGGYAGFSIRMAKETRSWSFRNSEDLKEMALHGKNARWVDASGKTVSGKDAGVAIFSHSSNMRSPTPWYLSKQMPFVSPAIIFNEPMTLEKNESFTLKYRILIHPGLPDKDELDREWKEFSTE